MLRQPRLDTPGALSRDPRDNGQVTLRLNSKLSNLEILADRICEREWVARMELCSGIRKRDVVKCRKIFCQIAVKKMGCSGADAARFLSITTSGVNRLSAFHLLLDTERYLKLF